MALWAGSRSMSMWTTIWVGHDHSAALSNLTLLNAVPSDRLWDDTRGWYLKLREHTVGISEKVRFNGDDGALSFWLKDQNVYGEEPVTLLEFGPVKFIYTGWTRVLSTYVDDVLIGSLSPAGLTFVALSKTATRVTLCFGSDSDEVTKTELDGVFLGL
jgi:hypothetical protein